MHEGRIEQVGSATEIYDDPATPFVAGFVGSANVLHGYVSEGHVHLGSFRLPGADHLEEGAAATAYVRPHDVRVTPDAEGASSKATVERMATLGWLARLTLRLASGETLVAHVPHGELHGAAEGDEIWVDLRNPKAFLRADTAPDASEEPARA
jgi:sulfate transport system ATP-binding protein